MKSQTDIDINSIKERRKELGIPLTYLANELAISAYNLDLMLVGKKPMPIDIASNIKSIFSQYSEAKQQPSYIANNLVRFHDNCSYVVTDSLLRSVLDITGDRLPYKNKYDLHIRDICNVTIRRVIQQDGWTYRLLSDRTGYRMSLIRSLCGGQVKRRDGTITAVKDYTKWYMVILTRVLAALNMPFQHAAITDRARNDYYRGIQRLKEWRANNYME